MLAREAVVSVAVLALAAAGARRIDVQWAGKAGTLALMFALPAVPAGPTPSHGDAHDVVLAVALVHRRSCGLVLSYYAALTYVPMARARAARGPQPRAPPRREERRREGRDPGRR